MGPSGGQGIALLWHESKGRQLAGSASGNPCSSRGPSLCPSTCSMSVVPCGCASEWPSSEASASPGSDVNRLAKTVAPFSAGAVWDPPQRKVPHDDSTLVVSAVSAATRIRQRLRSARSSSDTWISSLVDRIIHTEGIVCRRFKSRQIRRCLNIDETKLKR